MAERFEFELVFGLPDGDHDPFDLSDAVFEAGYADAIIGTGSTRLLAVEIEAGGDDAEGVILTAARSIIARLPAGTCLREIKPDLVSLADVAEKLNVTRQTLQQREMPLPVAGGLYRIDEVREALISAARPGRRRPRFDLSSAENWFKAGLAARRLNAKFAMHLINPMTMEAVLADTPHDTPK